VLPELAKHPRHRLHVPRARRKWLAHSSATSAREKPEALDAPGRGRRGIAWNGFSALRGHVGMRIAGGVEQLATAVDDGDRAVVDASTASRGSRPRAAREASARSRDGGVRGGEAMTAIEHRRGDGVERPLYRLPECECERRRAARVTGSPARSGSAPAPPGPRSS